MNCALPLKVEEEQNKSALPLLLEERFNRFPFELSKERDNRFPFELSEVQNNLSIIMQATLLFHNLTINLSATSEIITAEELHDITFEVV